MRIEKNTWLFCMLALAAFSACKESKTERYMREAKEVTEQCPLLLHLNLQMDSMVYEKTNHEFIYYYTLKTSEDFEAKDAETIRSDLFQQIINSPEMLPYIMDSINLRYIYRSSSSNEVIWDFVFPSEELIR